MSCPEEASASELSPGGLPVPVGCPVPVCLALEGCPVPLLFLSCPVCLAPEGSWYPLTSPGKFLFGGGRRVPAWRPPAMAARAPSSAMASFVCSALEVPVLCSCPCLSWGASRAPTSPPRWNCYGVGHAFQEGGVMSGFCCVSCVPASCFLIWFVSCPRLMWLLVHSCPAVFMWLCI